MAAPSTGRPGSLGMRSATGYPKFVYPGLDLGRIVALFVVGPRCIWLCGVGGGFGFPF